MTKVIVKATATGVQTDKAMLVLSAGEEVWVPKSVAYFQSENRLVLPGDMALDKGLTSGLKPFLHKPKKMDVEYGQEPIAELRLDPK